MCVISPECEDDLAKAMRCGEHVPVLRRQTMHAFGNGPRGDVLDCPHCALKRLRQVCPATDHTDTSLNKSTQALTSKMNSNNLVAFVFCHIPQRAAVGVDVVGDLGALQLQAGRQLAQMCYHSHLQFQKDNKRNKLIHV